MEEGSDREAWRQAKRREPVPVSTPAAGSTTRGRSRAAAARAGSSPPISYQGSSSSTSRCGPCRSTAGARSATIRRSTGCWGSWDGPRSPPRPDPSVTRRRSCLTSRRRGGRGGCRRACTRPAPLFDRQALHGVGGEVARRDQPAPRLVAAAAFLDRQVVRRLTDVDGASRRHARAANRQGENANSLISIRCGASLLPVSAGGRSAVPVPPTSPPPPVSSSPPPQPASAAADSTATSQRHFMP